MDQIICQKLAQLCEDNNCVCFYDKRGHGPHPVIVLYKSSRCVLSMGQWELKEYELPLHAHELLNPDWVGLSATIKEFATACSIRDCFN